MTGPSLSRGERLVWLALQTFADGAGFAAPSLAELAERAGYGKRQCAVIVSALVDKGVIVPAGFGQRLDAKGVTLRPSKRFVVPRILHGETFAALPH